jgi:pimeloyl-ACP methyl ester carboxylesterase
VNPTTVCFGQFQFDRAQRRLFRNGAEVTLAPKCGELLAAFLEAPNRLLSRTELSARIWPDTFVEDHTLSVLVAELRKVLGDNPKSPAYIETRARRGYRFLQSLQPMAQPQPRASTNIPETRYAASGDWNIAYQVLGEGPLDIVFVMGWVSHLEYFWREPHFEKFLKRLAGLGRLILFDKRGTGLSDRVPANQLPTLEQRMEDVRAVMRAANSQRAVLFGVSEGGPMAMLFAATYPSETLGLITFGSYARRLWDEDYPWGPKPAERHSYIEQLAQLWGGPVGIEERAPSLSTDPDFRDWWATYLRMGASPGSAVALTRMNAEIDVRPILPGIRVPSLILHRREDRCLLAAESQHLAERIPNAQLRLLPGADHLPFVGDQESIFAPLEAFFASLAAPSAVEVTLRTALLVKLNQLPPRASDILHAHRAHALPQQSINHHAFVFEGPVRALRCALELLKLPEVQDSALALHTAEFETPQPGELARAALAVADSILADCRPGEVRVTRVVKDLVAGSGLRFQERGAIRVNGVRLPLFLLLR